MRVLSASFDVFPGPKGACTHIKAFAQALAMEFDEIHLVTIQNNNEEWSEQSSSVVAELSSEGISHHGLPCIGRNVIERALSYRRHLGGWLRDAGRFDAIHVRSIFEAYPVAKQKTKYCDVLVFECNGLPSIELKYHYPKVAQDDELLSKLRFQEMFCLEKADLIVTPSAVTKNYLTSLGLPAEKIEIIRNGVDIDLFSCSSSGGLKNEDEPLKLLYPGTMTSWQGVLCAIDALNLLRRDVMAELFLVGPVKKTQRKNLERYIFEQGLTGQVTLVPPVTQPELVDWHHKSDILLVPLPSNDRNVIQGCCPLKLLEGMACGIPIVATGLDVVRELATPDEHVVMVKPNSPKALKDGVLRYLANSDLARRLSQNAREHVEKKFQWRHAQEHLRKVYRVMLSNNTI